MRGSYLENTVSTGAQPRAGMESHKQHGYHSILSVRLQRRKGLASPPPPPSGFLIGFNRQGRRSTVALAKTKKEGGGGRGGEEGRFHI
jgi:hypothetical protein